jgi:hypothetical protein
LLFGDTIDFYDIIIQFILLMLKFWICPTTAEVKSVSSTKVLKLKKKSYFMERL